MSASMTGGNEIIIRLGEISCHVLTISVFSLQVFIRRAKVAKNCKKVCSATFSYECKRGTIVQYSRAHYGRGF